MDQPGISVASLLRHLRAGSSLAFKVWRLHPLLIAIAGLLLGAAATGAVMGLVYLMWHHTQVLVPVNLGSLSKSILFALGALVLGALFPLAKAWIKRVRPLLKPGSALAQVAFGVVMASVGWFVCRLHLCFFDRIFLRLGRVRR